MKKEKSFGTILFRVIIALILLWAVYRFPVQWALCRIAWKEYRQMQGIDKADIDWSLAVPEQFHGTVWVLKARYLSDPDNVYEYRYNLKPNVSGTKMWIGRMSCLAYTAKGENLVISPKYPPMEDYEKLFSFEESEGFGE